MMVGARVGPCDCSTATQHFCLHAASRLPPAPPQGPARSVGDLVDSTDLWRRSSFAGLILFRWPMTSIRRTDLILIWSPCLVPLLSGESRGFRGTNGSLRY